MIKYYMPELYLTESGTEAISNEHLPALKQEIEEHIYNCIKLYNDMLAIGIKQDQAIDVLPLGLVIDKIPEENQEVIKILTKG